MLGDEAGAVATVGAPRARRGRYAKSTVTRAAILDAALDVFSEDGYRTGSLHEIARRVNISEPGVLHHFGSKPKLLAAVLARRDEISEQRMPRSSTDGVVMLRSVLGIAEHNATEPGVLELYCMLAAEASSPDHPAHTYFANRYDDVRARVGRAFSDLERRGLLRPGIDPEFAARATVAFMDGLKVQWLIDRSILDMPEDVRRFLNAITLVDF